MQHVMGPLGLRALVRGSWLLVVLLSASACGGGGGGDTPEESFPALAVTTPARDLTVQLVPVQTITIRFTDRNAAPTSRIDVVADRDGLPNTTDDQIVIATDIAPLNGAEHEVAWQVGGVFNGDYVVYVRMQMGEDLYVYGRAPGRVRINGFPTFAVTGPQLNTTISRGGLLCYGYTVSDPEDDPTVELTLDADGDFRTSEDAYPLILPPNRPGCTVNDTPTVPAGTYRIVGTADDGVNGPVGATAPARVEVKNASWAKSWGGVESAGIVETTTYDDGSTVVCGTLRGTVVFGASEPGATTLTSNGGQDLYVARFRADGTLQWARSMGGTAHDWISGLAPHPDGGFVITGSYTTSIEFGVGESTYTRLQATSAGQDRFVARFGQNGNLLWVKNRGGKNPGDEDRGGPIAVFPDGSIIAWGAAQDRSVPPLSTMRGTLERFDADGDEVWTKEWSEYGQYWRPAFAHLRVLDDGGFLGVIHFTGTVTFGAGTPDETSFTAGSATNNDLLICAFDGDGDLRWGKHIRGSTGRVRASGIDLFEDESFVVAGSFPDTVTFGAGEAGELQRTSQGGFDGFLAWFDADGDFRRVRTVGSPVGPPGGVVGEGDDWGADVAVLADGSCVLHASVWGNVTIEDTAAPTVLPLGYANMNVLSARFDAVGTLRWTRTDAKAAAAGWLTAGRIEALPDGSCVCAGHLQGAVVLGAGEASPVALNGPVFGAHPYLTRINADGGY